MITWEILYHPETAKDFRRIGVNAATKVKKVVNEKLTTNPLEFGEDLKHNLKNLRKLRIGNLRVVSPSS